MSLQNNWKQQKDFFFETTFGVSTKFLETMDEKKIPARYFRSSFLRPGWEFNTLEVEFQLGKKP